MTHAGMQAHLPPWRAGLPTTALLILALVVPLFSCNREPTDQWGRRSKDTHKVIEYIEVKGECFEDHVKQSAPYAGSIVHWYNVTTGQHSRYGDVLHEKELTPETLEERLRYPYKYQPPFTIHFQDLQAEDLEGEWLQLPGISNFTAEGEGGRYESTCFLNVMRRLDHLPPLEEAAQSRRTSP